MQFLMIVNNSLRFASLLGILLLILAIHIGDATSDGHYFRPIKDQAASYSHQILGKQLYPLKFPGYIFVPLTPQKKYALYKTPFNMKIPNLKDEPNGFKGINTVVVDNFIDNFLQERFLDLMKEEIIAHYASDQLKGKTASFLPFDIDSITNKDLRHGFSNYHDKGYEICKSCPPGAKGRVGKPGSVGGRGLFGDKGVLGPVGNKGVIGEEGHDGFEVKGTKGHKGQKGRIGHHGPPGSKGHKGDKGRKGIKGIEHKGPIGSALPGSKGSHGDSIYCCDPGFYVLFASKCAVHYHHRVTYQEAYDTCTEFTGGDIFDLSNAVDTASLETAIHFLDTAGSNIWSFTTGFSSSTSQCKRFAVDDNSIIEVPCVFLNDFICIYTSSDC